MRAVTLTIEQLAIISNGLSALKDGWKEADAFPEEERLKVVSRIESVEASLKNQTGL